MRKFVMTLALAGALVTGVAAASALYAEEPQSPAHGPGGSMTAPDMQRMMEMMGMCHKMMQGATMGDPGSQKPHEK